MFGGYLSGSGLAVFISSVLMGLELWVVSISQTFDRKRSLSVLSILSTTGNGLMINTWSSGEPSVCHHPNIVGSASS